MRIITGGILLLTLSLSAFGQGDRGSITGTIADPAGAVVAGAKVEARHVETGVVYPAESTSTGNYTIAQLPVGSYELSVTVAGFKKYVRQGLTLQVADVLRADVTLQVGAASESITVTEAAPLLRTESGEVSANVTSERLDNLPVLGIGASAAGSSGIRNPQAVASLLPGTFVQPNATLRVNGAPSNTASYRVEGQDASNGQVPATQAQVQPSIDAIQEVTIQTSNFAAEYGQVGGGFFNYTMRSGGNRFHGSVYDYAVNEVFNAATPWVNTKPVARRHDYGFTIGGPVVLPKLYNGHDKTFFFFNWEQFRETQNINNQSITVPVDAFRAGNFLPAELTGKNIAPANAACAGGVGDPACRPMFANEIYDPLTPHVAPSGAIYTDPFLNNAIPANRFDSVALKIQSMIPEPTIPGLLVSNAIYPYLSKRVTDIPAVKVDHSFSSKAKISYYWSQIRTASQYSPTLGGSDGLPTPITAAIGTFIWAHVQRLNFDYTLTPTMLLHIGAGYQNDYFTDDAPVQDYNELQQLGLKGGTLNRLFPGITGLSNNQGGMKTMGPNIARHPLLYEKPTGNLSLTWVRSNHTYKFGGEMRVDSNSSTLYTNTAGTFAFSANETATPFNQTTNFGGSNIGFPYASFLLGLADSVTVAYPNSIRVGKHQVGLFVQDTWKITRKLTLDYGLRWDYSSYLKEQYGRFAQFAPTIPNPSAGGRLGAVQFEGDGPGRCNCNFANIYPYAIGPRIGVAYQINAKTVLRGGWGIVYAGTGDSNGATQGALTEPQAALSPAFGTQVMTLQNGIPFAPIPFPNFDVGQYPQPGYATKQAPPTWYDQNAGRPARQMQWSFGVQRELTKDMVVEATYVGNRGAWWYASQLVDANALTPALIASAGLNINSTADQTLLNSTIGSSTASQRGFATKLPYAGFPTTATVAQSLRPFPQFSSMFELWAPLGKTWYDGLQAKLTKRVSHGLSVTSAFSWQKQMALGATSNPVVGAGGTSGGAPVNDVFNRSQNKYISSFDQPYTFNVAANYTVPAYHTKKFVSWAVRDWTVNTLLGYSSGLPIQAPAAQNNLALYMFRSTFANRVPGQPLFTKDLNCHCFDPSNTFVLNPAAWSDPAKGQFGTSAAYYSDYRLQRRPNETMSLGRIFPIKEKASLNIRIEFTNVFNRAETPNPTSTNALAQQTRAVASDPNSRGTAGFGWINTLGVAATTSSGTPTSRQGAIVARFVF